MKWDFRIIINGLVISVLVVCVEAVALINRLVAREQ